MELHVKPVQALTGGVLGAETNVALVNGLSNTIFKSVTVFINEKMIETNPFFNYSTGYFSIRTLWIFTL